MQKLRKLIQSPTSLFAFEAAARHGSFTKAAAELNVSQPAVSFAIKQLEASLGVTLFERRHRVIRLTDAGETFFKDVSIGLSHIGQSAEGLSQVSYDEHVTVSTSTAFANYWIVPRLSEFKTRFPDIDLRLQCTDQDGDLVSEGITLGIRRGKEGDWPGYEAERLTDEIIHAVCSPAHRAASETISKAEDLLNYQLIHLEEPYRPRPTWSDWFASHGVSYKDKGDGLRLNDYALVLQTAMAAQGIAMGWQHVTDSLVERGLLHRIEGLRYHSGSAFCMIWNKATPLNDKAQAVRDWILSGQ
ncbi:LysR substrate-binding domain-containing protein [Coralliovum pocilloporae]|uniref:LysR substrate-binding domain-containing protein n=1 Tax=Coralliovum pocilloporae TaxID=3066369 RepID=UPI0033077E97